MLTAELGRRAYGIREVAESFGIAPESLKRLVREDRIKTIQVGGRRLVPLTEVQRMERDGIPRGNRRKATAEQ